MAEYKSYRALDSWAKQYAREENKEIHEDVAAAGVKSRHVPKVSRFIIDDMLKARVKRYKKEGPRPREPGESPKHAMLVWNPEERRHMREERRRRFDREGGPKLAAAAEKARRARARARARAKALQ